MATFENGVQVSIDSLVSGLLESTALMIAVSVSGSLQAPLNLVLLLFSFAAFVGLAQRMNYWGIAYTLGWVVTFVWIVPSVLSGGSSTQRNFWACSTWD